MFRLKIVKRYVSLTLFTQRQHSWYNLKQTQVPVSVTRVSSPPPKRELFSVCSQPLLEQTVYLLWLVHQTTHRSSNGFICPYSVVGIVCQSSSLLSNLIEISVHVSGKIHLEHDLVCYNKDRIRGSCSDLSDSITCPVPKRWSGRENTILLMNALHPVNEAGCQSPADDCICSGMRAHMKPWHGTFAARHSLGKA